MNESSQHPQSPWSLAWSRFRRNRLAMLGLIVIALAAIIAVLGAHIRPDSTRHANSQQLALASKPPGFELSMLALRNNAPLPESDFFGALFFGGKPQKMKHIPLHDFVIQGDSIRGYSFGGEAGVPGLPFAYHLADVCYALASVPKAADAGFDKLKVERIGEAAIEISAEELAQKVREEHILQQRFILGTDKFGRDMLSRLMAGTIVSLSVGLISVLISLVLGMSLGALAGYFGAWVDDLITWLINVVWSIPTLLLVIAITFALGKGFVQVFVAVGLTMWVEVARVVRGQVLGLRNLEFVEAGRALGYRPGRIIFRHIMPNVLGPVIVVSAANFASAILLEAGLSFLGIGAQIPMASWGQMIKEHYAYITTSMAYLALLPGFCIMLLVLAFMLVGNGLRDSLDSRL